jgi:cystathionine beta-lyase
MKESTQILHQGDTPEQYYGAVNPPVVHASLYGFRTYQEFVDAYSDPNHRPSYHRSFNPTVRALERKIADLEHAEQAIAFSSGMGAITASLLALLSQGDHLLIAACVYGPTRQFCEDTLTRLGIEVEFFPPDESSDLSGRLRNNTQLIYLESPGSLTFTIQNIPAVAKLARSRDIYTLADNSWATPLYQKPLEMGVDIVVHSGTKYIAGHSDLTLGLLACSTEMFDIIKPMAVLLGANLAPDDAYLALRGLRTLPLRLAQHQTSALTIAHWLQKRPEVREVLHPGLPEFSEYELARQQLSGYSSLFSFRLQPGTAEARRAFLDALQLFLIGVSWGGYESLIIPLGNSHKSHPKLRTQLGLDDDTFRISIGLEDPDDLIADLEKGLAVWRAAMD